MEKEGKQNMEVNSQGTRKSNVVTNNKEWMLGICIVSCNLLKQTIGTKPPVMLPGKRNS